MKKPLKFLRNMGLIALAFLFVFAVTPLKWKNLSDVSVSLLELSRLDGILWTTTESNMLVGVDTTKTLAEQLAAKQDTGMITGLDTTSADARYIQKDSVVDFSTSEFVGIADSVNINDMSAQSKVLGGSLVCTNLPPVYLSIGNVTALYVNSLRITSFVITKDTTIAYIGWNTTTAATGTANGDNIVAIFSTDGTTATKIAQTANDISIFEQSGYHLVPLSTSVHLTKGIYHLVWINMVTGGTTMSVSGFSPLTNWYAYGWGNSVVWINGYIGSATSMPSTFTEADVSASTGFSPMVVFYTN